MVYTYTPTYYSSLHDSITSLCKNILPFSFKKRRLPGGTAAEQKLSKLQSDNLKWQQESFHQILNLMGLCREGIVTEVEVSAFRTQLLDVLIASPADPEQAVILRDKLLFLQELFYAKSISEEQYHSSKRPLLQRLAVQGAEIEARDVIVAEPKGNPEEEWSVIDLRDEDCLLNKESHSKNKSKHGSTMKHIRGAGASVFGLVSPHKHGKNKEGKDVTDPMAKHFGPSFSKERGTKSILMPETLPPVKPIKEDKGRGDDSKKKPFRTLFQREQNEKHSGVDDGDDHDHDPEGRAKKSAKKQWGFDGFKKWKKSSEENETTPLKLSERSDDGALSEYCHVVAESPIGEGPDIKQIKRKLHPDGSTSDFFIDKVLGDKIKKELSRIQTELSSSNSNLHFSNDQIEAISTKLPVDKADLKKFFPKSWCERYGDVVLDVVKKEFKDHVGEMESMRIAAREKRTNSTQWTAFVDEDVENSDPNAKFYQDRSFSAKQGDYSHEKLGPESFVNPFCAPSNYGSSMG